MRLARRVLLSALTVAMVAASPAAAGNLVAHAVHGTRTATTRLNTETGAATTVSSGYLYPIGAYTGTAHEQFIPTSLTTFTFSGTVTLVTTNGDKLFATFAGSGQVTSVATRKSTNTFTIVGGTGRFAGASGTLTETVSSTVVSATPDSVTAHDIAFPHGTITYADAGE